MEASDPHMSAPPFQALVFVPSSAAEDPVPVRLGFDPCREFLELDVEPHSRDLITNTKKLRSWFGPNGQYIRELPCPSCRGRGYTPCAECGIERSRVDCTECNGKFDRDPLYEEFNFFTEGLKTCQQCSGDRVIWEESIDEGPWEKARSSSPFKVKEDDEVDKLEIKADVTKRSKRVYHSPPPEVGMKISQSLKILNAKTGLFSKRMKILHRDPKLHAERVAAIKKAKGTDAARKQASETMKTFFSNLENRLKRSIAMKANWWHNHGDDTPYLKAMTIKILSLTSSSSGCERNWSTFDSIMTPFHRPNLANNLLISSCSCFQETGYTPYGVKFNCRHCGEEGHRRHYCPSLKRESKQSTFRCRLCGESGHNRRTCGKELKREAVFHQRGELAQSRKCKICGESGHNRRTCNKPVDVKSNTSDTSYDARSTAPANKQTRLCSLCSRPGHNVRTCRRRNSS